MKTNRDAFARTTETTCRCDLAEHRRAALVALCSVALEVDELRDELDELRATHVPARGLEDAYEEIAQMEARLYDEARALRLFDDEYECACGASDAIEDTGRAEPLRDDETAARFDAAAAPCSCHEHVFEDEQEPNVPPKAPRRVPIAATIFGLLGTACAVAAMLLSTPDTGSQE
jgi:hypothetical protein